MVLNRPTRAAAVVAVVLVCVLFFIHGSGPSYRFFSQLSFPPGEDPMGQDPGLPRGILQPAGPEYSADNDHSPRISATLMSLVRNSELEGMLQSMRDLERTWNRKFNYPWTFMNDVPFTEEFKRRTQAETNASCTYRKSVAEAPGFFGSTRLLWKHPASLEAPGFFTDLVPASHWRMPKSIDKDRWAKSARRLKSSGVQYGNMKSYHQMCRWNSGLFYKHPAMLPFRYYWRVEPKVHFFCDVDYDVFRYMHDNNKTYGFVINLFDDPKSLPSLWPETQKFIRSHPEYVHPNNALGWLTDASLRPGHNKVANGYSTCHFWSNFEIADMSFWRSKIYEDYFNHLDQAGGFYYERWGDAPVHSVALGLFEDKNRIHWFRDIGYQHIPFFNCPNSPKCSNCVKGRFTSGMPWLNREDCRPLWFKHAHLD